MQSMFVAVYTISCRCCYRAPFDVRRDSVQNIHGNVRTDKNQQDAKIRCLLLTSVSTCFGHHYAHLQENKGPVTAFGVYWSGFIGCGW